MTEIEGGRVLFTPILNPSPVKGGRKNVENKDECLGWQQYLNTFTVNSANSTIITYGYFIFLALYIKFIDVTLYQGTETRYNY